MLEESIAALGARFGQELRKLGPAECNHGSRRSQSLPAPRNASPAPRNVRAPQGRQRAPRDAKAASNLGPNLPAENSFNRSRFSSPRFSSPNPQKNDPSLPPGKGILRYRSCTLPPRLPPGVFDLIAHGGRFFVLISHGLVVDCVNRPRISQFLLFFAPRSARNDP